MKITFYSNYLTHHQIPFCDEMYRLFKDDFTFVSTKKMEIERKSGGWGFKNEYAYEIKSYQNKEELEKAVRLSRESDVVIYGSAPELFFKERMANQSPGITFRYSERIYKNGRWRVLSPRGLLIRMNTYFIYRNKNIYMLCASAFTAADLMLLASYIGKCYKWGYFPEVKEHDIKLLINRKEKHITPKLLWAGRFLNWKHPEDAIEVAKMLKKEGYDFTLDIIGTGSMEKVLKDLIEKYQLSEQVKFLGSMNPDEVRAHMEVANIYLFTSDFNEGWGAVLNEAMNSGCAIVASHAIGSVPYLLENEKNGLIYKSGNVVDLYNKVKYYLDNPEKQWEYGVRAYRTLFDTWNAKVATERLMLLIEDLNEKGYSKRFQNGPCSKAEVLRNNWFGE